MGWERLGAYIQILCVWILFDPCRGTLPTYMRETNLKSTPAWASSSLSKRGRRDGREGYRTRGQSKTPTDCSLSRRTRRPGYTSQVRPGSPYLHQVHGIWAHVHAPKAERALILDLGGRVTMDVGRLQRWWWEAEARQGRGRLREWTYVPSMLHVRSDWVQKFAVG